MALAPGQVLQGRYRIVALLGQGGMGAVYRAWDMRLDVVMALKEMIPQPGLDSQALAQLRQQFEQEAMILARLHHPHLVRVTDFFEEGGNAYLVMDFVEGESLDHRIEREGALPEQQVLEWADQLLSALTYCHGQGIIHRDIKPQNVVIRPDGQAVLVDFGLVKLWDPRHPHTRTAMRGLGTPEYSPPEQYDVQMGHTDPRSDIYSVGATLYHALTGKAPPTATMRIASPDVFHSPRDVNPQLSPAVEAAVVRATELMVSKRFDTAQEMAAALRGQGYEERDVDLGAHASPTVVGSRLPGGPVVSAPRTVSEPRVGAVAQPAQRSRLPTWVWIVGALVLLLLVAGVAVGVWFWNQGPTATPQVAEVATLPVLAGTGTATPSVSPSPTWTSVPERPTDISTKEPTQTPRPTRTPVATSTPSGTPRATPAATLSPTPTSKARTTTPTPTSRAVSSSDALITFEQWGSWRRGDQPYGELTQTREEVRSGSYAARLRYDFPSGGDDYVVFVHSLSLAGQPNTVGAWVYGDGSGHYLNVWIQDARDEIWSVHLGSVGGSGWRRMVGVLDSNLTWPSGHVSGPENGRIDYPVRFYALVLDRPGSGGRTGRIYIDDISVWQGDVSAAATPASEPTSTPVIAGPASTVTPSPVPTAPPPPPGQVGRIFYTIEADQAYYLASTDPSWSQGQIIGPIAYDQSTCAGGATVQTLAGQTFNLYYGYRCGVSFPKHCPAPNGERKVTIWESGGKYSLTIRQVSDDALIESIYNGPLNQREPILWAPDSSYFYFTVDQTLHRASPYSAGYRAVVPMAQQPYLSPDGSMILYIQPVGSVGAYDIWAANADGSNLHNVTNAPETYKLCARWGR